MMKKWAGNLLLMLGAIIATLVVLEFALRFIYPTHGTWRLHSIPDPEMGWVLEPGAEFTRQVPGAFVHVRYNSDGFRDSEHAGPLPEDATRIVVLGDSFMEANMVPLDEIFHKQLERAGTADGRKIATYNLGVAGYGTLQEYLAYRRAGAKHEPDLVLLAFYLHNDVRNNAEHLNRRAQSRQRSGKRKRPYLDEANEAEWRILKPHYEAMQQKFLRRKNSLAFRIRHNSVLLTLIRNTRRTFRSRADTFRSGGMLIMHSCKSAEQYEKGWRTTERILQRLKRDTESSGARLVVFTAPALFDADMAVANGLAKAAKKKRGLDMCLEESPGYRQLQTILERNGIAYIDLVPAFRRAAAQEKRKLFVSGDWHWNGDGHALAAQQVYDVLKSGGYLHD